MNETNYTWSDGTPALFTDWSPDESNRLEIAQCVIIVGKEFQWVSKDCTTEDNVLCPYQISSAVHQIPKQWLRSSSYAIGNLRLIPLLSFLDPTNNIFPISNDIDQIGDNTTTFSSATYPDSYTTISATYPSISTSRVNAGEVIHRHFVLNCLDIGLQNQPYHVTQGQIKIRCADHCLADHVCAAFVFNGWQCLLYNSFNLGLVNHIAGSRIWK